MKKSTVENNMNFEQDPVASAIKLAGDAKVNVNIFNITQEATQKNKSEDVSVDVMCRPTRGLDSEGNGEGGNIINVNLVNAVDNLMNDFEGVSLIDISRAFVMACYRKGLQADRVAFFSGYAKHTVNKFRKNYLLSEG